MKKIIVCLALSVASALAQPLIAQAIIDVHVHTSELNKPGEPGHIDSILTSLDEAGVEKAFLLSDGYFVSEKDQSRTKIENDHVVSLVKKHPTRFYGFCAVHILDSNGPNEVKRCADQGLVGLKLHPLAQGVAFPDFWPVDLTKAEHVEKLRGIFQAALDENLIVIMDSALFSQMAVMNVFRLHQQFPKLRLILAHALGTDFRLLNFFRWVYSFYPAGSVQNLYIDISTCFNSLRFDPEKDLWMKTIRNFGVENVLYGSDYPWFQPKTEIQEVRNHFTPQEAELILRKNAERLLGSQ